MKKNKVVTAEEAVAKIRDGDCLAIHSSGGGLGEPQMLLTALRDRYRKESTPKGLTLFHTSGVGDKAGSGNDLIAIEGLIKRDIGGHWAMAPEMGKLALEEKIEAYNLPQGVMSQMYQAIAAKMPGVITKIGLNTFVDPRLEGGLLNKRTTEPLVKVIELDGEEWLFYPRHHLNVCFIRGTTADEDGNISTEQEAAILDGISVAQATRNCGGIVIAQVKYLAQRGTLKAQDVRIPGILVDYVVVDAEQKQTADGEINPSLAGSLRIPLGQVPALPLGERKVVARRAAKELQAGAVVNLGFGMGDGVASVAAEEGIIGDINFVLEQGIVGGMPASGIIFGCSYNPDAIIDATHQFNFFDGGGLDATFLGMAQADASGNVNSSKTGKLLSGCGGFINISQNAKAVVFCSTFTAKGLRVKVGGGKLTIEQGGQIKKFVHAVEQVTFSAKNAHAVGQKVLYVTERAVFRLGAKGLVLIEIAPGIDLQKDVLDQMEFKPEVDANLKIMDPAIFS